MVNPRVLFLSYDLYGLGYVNQISNVQEWKSYRKDKLWSNQYDLQCENFDDFFSVGKSTSVLNGIDWLYESIKIYNRDEEKIWDGIVTDIIRDHESKKAILKTKSLLTKFQKQIIEYESSTWETAAEAFSNICNDAGFTAYNQKAYQNSKAQLESADCKIKVNFNLSDGITFQQAIEKLGEYGGADVYMHAGEIYFAHWTEYIGGATVHIIDIGKQNERFKKMPVVSNDAKEIINDYSIGYSGSTTNETDSSNNNLGLISRNRYGTQSLPEMASKDNAQIVFEKASAVVYIGEQYIKRTMKNNNPRIKTTFSIFADFKQYITLDTYVYLTLQDEGWLKKLFEIFKYEIDEDNDEIKITAYEV